MTEQTGIPPDCINCKVDRHKATALISCGLSPVLWLLASCPSYSHHSLDSSSSISVYVPSLFCVRYLWVILERHDKGNNCFYTSKVENLGLPEMFMYVLNLCPPYWRPNCIDSPWPSILGDPIFILEEGKHILGSYKMNRGRADYRKGTNTYQMCHVPGTVRGFVYMILIKTYC